MKVDSQYSEISDEALVAQIVEAKKTNLFAILYDRYASLIYRKCCSLVKEEATAKDLTHDILIKVFLNISKFKGKSDFSLWVYAISYNHCMQYFKKKKRLNFELEEDLTNYDDISIQDIENKEHKWLEEQLQRLEICMEHLKADYKLILSMRYFAEMSVKNIAVSLQIGESAVKMRLKRGRDKLASCVQATKPVI